MDMAETHSDQGIMFRPITGTILAVAAGLSFFFLCMILPLVGPAGSKVEHAGRNEAAFISALFVTLALAAAAAYSKLGRSKSDGGPLPWFSLGLSAVCILTFIVLLLGGFAI
jgi:hypothetical protein